MPTTTQRSVAPKPELPPCRSDKTDIDAAQALVDAVRRGDSLTVQRITRRPDIARIAVALADRIALPQLQPCGTRSAAERHLANGEALDSACLAARRRYYRDIKRGQRPGRETPASSTSSSSPAVDPVVVERLIAGQPPLHVTKGERAEAVRVLDGRGRTRSEIAVQLHMSGGRVAQILDRLVRPEIHTPDTTNDRQEASA